MKRNTGIAQLTAARTLLSDTQLESFFRAAGTEDHPRAPGIVSDGLKKGRTLNAIFSDFPNTGSLREELHIMLKVKRLSPRTFALEFGFSGAQVGDGGSWRVVFGPKGNVVRIEGTGFWIH